MNLFRDIGRPVLSDKTIIKYNKKQLLIETPIQPIQLQPNSVDLTLSDSIKRLRNNASSQFAGIRTESDIIGHYEPYIHIDPSMPMKYDTIQLTHGYYDIRPGEFILMASNEVLNIPNGILAFVQGRSSIARMGIQTEQAGLIDAGFRGTITLEVFNQTRYPIRLYKGMRVAQVYFLKAQFAKQLYGPGHLSKYSGQIEATGSNIDKDPEFSQSK